MVKAASAPYNCIRTEDIQDSKVFIRLAQVEHKSSQSGSEITVHLMEEIVSYWSANLHLKLLTLQREIANFIVDVKRNFGLKSSKSTKDTNILWNIRISGVFAFHIWISKKHSAKISLGKFLTKLLFKNEN